MHSVTKMVLVLQLVVGGPITTPGLAMQSDLPNPLPTACDTLREWWLSAPPPQVSNHPLVMLVGEGTTGTKTLTSMVSSLMGKDCWAGHFSTMYNKGEFLYAKYNLERKFDYDVCFERVSPKEKALSLRKGISAEFMTGWRKQACNFTGRVKRLVDLGPSDRDQFDFRIFNDMAAVADTPIPQFFPYLLRAYPNARVIISSRNASDWWASRRRNHGNKATLPFQFPWKSIFGMYTSSKDSVHQDGNTRNDMMPMMLFELHQMLVECMVAPSKLVKVNLFEQDTKVVRDILQDFLTDTSNPGDECRPPNRMYS